MCLRRCSRAADGSDDPVADGEDGGLAAGGDIEFGQDGAYVLGGRARADGEGLADLGVGQPPAEKGEDFALAPGETEATAFSGSICA